MGRNFAEPARLYGATLNGGPRCGIQASGCGTVYKLAPDGRLTTLHFFAGGRGGLYGTTDHGGPIAGRCSR